MWDLEFDTSSRAKSIELARLLIGTKRSTYGKRITQTRVTTSIGEKDWPGLIFDSDSDLQEADNADNE